MAIKIDHIGVAVRDLEKAVDAFSTLLGHTPEGYEEVSDQKVKLAIFGAGESRVELLEGTAPDSPISRFIEKKGAGIHHICFEVKDLEAEIARLKKEGATLIDQTPRKGAEGTLVAFVHPKSTAGILIELNQKTGQK